MTKFLVPLLTILLIGCNSSKKSEFTYFGGKIINPKGDYVFLFDEEKVIDSIQLEEDYTFMGKLKNITPGLYYFKHGPEHQYVYLEPNDSLLIRLNTWDFDESLVFSGVNSHRNNTLIEAFLQNELDHKNFYKYFSLPANEFEAKVDSSLAKKTAILTNYKNDTQETSQQFLDVLEIVLNYPLYSKLENYIIENSFKSTPENITKNFTKHREITDLNKDSLMFLGAYNEFVHSSLYGEVYQNKHHSKDEDLTITLLNNINTKITSEKLKNKLLRRATINHFYDRSSCNINQEAFDTFLNLSTNNEDKNIIKNLLNDIKLIVKETELPNFEVMAPDGSMQNINELIKNKKVAIYFRNKKYSSDDWVEGRINYLIKNNPTVDFLVININDDKHSFVNGLDIKHQYYLHKKSEAHTFLTSEFPRVILVNDKGIVQNGFGALSSKKIIKQIADL